MDKIVIHAIGIRVVRVIDAIVNTAVLTIFFLLIAYSVYAIWDSDQVYHAADAARYAVYKPTIEDEGISFEQLKSINSDVFAWLTVYGTGIDYPVTQGNDNMQYVNTNVYGDYSLSGSIFLDSYNSKKFDDFNSILYGHHMEKQAMFGDLDRFRDRNFFESHAYGNLYYAGEDHGLEFFAFIKTDAYDNSVFTPKVQGQAERELLLKDLLSKALYIRNMDVTVEDHILLLTTCSSDTTNGRDVLVARITNESYSDPFILEKTDNEYQLTAVDSRSSILDNIPLWVKLTVSMIFILLIIIILVTIRNKRAKR